MTTKHGDELLARLVISAALGVSVQQHDDQSRPAMHDLTIIYPDGRRAAAEVVSTRDRRALALEAAATRIGYNVRPELTRMWMGWVERAARLNELVRAAPALLADLEARGIHRLRRGSGLLRSSKLSSLGVLSCSSRPPTGRHPPGFYLNPFPSGAWVGDGDDIVRACDAFLAQTNDVPAKLLVSGATERHVVVVVTVDWLGPFSSIEDGALPQAAPTLPVGVDAVWMVALTSPPIRAIYWLDGAWRDIALTQGDLDSLTASIN